MAAEVLGRRHRVLEDSEVGHVVKAQGQLSQRQVQLVHAGVGVTGTISHTAAPWGQPHCHAVPRRHTGPTPNGWWPLLPASPLPTLTSPGWLSLGSQGPVLPLALSPRLVPLGLPLLGWLLQGLLVAGFADSGGAVLGQQLPETGSGLP